MPQRRRFPQNAPFLAAGVLLCLAAGCGEADGQGERVFVLDAGRPAAVSIVGDFTGWQPEPLLDPDGNGVYSRRLPVGTGDHLYRFTVDGGDRLDPINPLSFYHDGVEHSWLFLPEVAKPSLSVVAVDPGGPALTVDLLFSTAPGGSPLDPGSVALAAGGRQAAVTVRGAAISARFEGLPAGKHEVCASAADRDGRPATEICFWTWAGQPPFDWRDAVVYQVVTDRFRRGGGGLAAAGITLRHGGDFDGIVEAVEEGYFASLGANVLWISPPYDNPEGLFAGFDGREYQGYHGYWPAEPRAVEPAMGGEAGLDRLVAAAHAAGLRVVMDLVPNHVHRDHPYFRDHRGEWFMHPDGDCVCGSAACPWGSHIRECWFTDYLPDLDYTNRAVVERAVDDAVWWLERFSFDGLRIDAVFMMPRLVTRHLRARVDERFGRGGARVWLVGETFTGTGGYPWIRWWLGPHGLDGQFDFPLMWTLRSALAGDGRMTDVERVVLEGEAAWRGSGAVMGRILGNHDVTRLISALNRDRALEPGQPAEERPYLLQTAAFTLLLAFDQAPVIYYGDEIGLAGGSDPDNRRPMPWQGLSERQLRLRERVGRLGRARACLPALRRGGQTVLFADDDRLVVMREAGDGRPAVAAVNRSGRPWTAVVPLPTGLLAPDSNCVDILGGDSYADPRSSDVRFNLPGYASALVADLAGCE